MMGKKSWLQVIVVSTIVSMTVSLAVHFTINPNLKVENKNFQASVEPVILNSEPQIPKECAEDDAKFCATAKDSSERDACLHDHFDKVQKDCQNSLLLVRNSFSGCRQEIQEHCKDIGYGGGRMMNCLRKNLSKLSPVCKKRVVGI